MAGSETGVNRDQEISGRPLSAASVLASLYVTRRTKYSTCPQGFLPMLNLKTYLIKEHVGMMKLHDTYDIFDAETNEQVGVAKETISTFATILRLLVNKQLIPTTVTVTDMDDEVVFKIHRPFSLWRARVNIENADGEVLGGGFYVYDNNDEQFAEVKGDWKGWNFKFLTADGKQLGTVAKKWAGLAKEFFTSADNYVIALNDSVAKNKASIILLLAAGLAIDVIYKEHG
jgi:uncharacterized protein YxjI